MYTCDESQLLVTATVVTVITNESFIENIAMLAPLGKSYHSMLNIDCKLQIDILIKVKKINYNKGDYDGLRQSLQLNWQELLLPLQNDIDAMWLAFKGTLRRRIAYIFFGPS